MMELAANARIELGAIVRFEAPGSRQTEGQPRMIPAVVTNVWPDGSLQLYALHFEGSFLVNQIATDQVVPVLSLSLFLEMLDSFDRRIRMLEHGLAGHATEEVEQPREKAMAAAAPIPIVGLPVAETGVFAGLKYKIVDDGIR